MRLSLEDRFWSKVKRTENENECWLWRAKAKSKNGYYGKMSYVGSQKLTSHHIAWLLTHGEIPEGKWVLHDCGVSLCCNPNHLKLGTPQENADDRRRHAKERGDRGWSRRLTDYSHPSKLSVDKRDQIRQLARQNISTHKIAEMLSISRYTAWKYSKI